MASMLAVCLFLACAASDLAAAIPLYPTYKFQRNSERPVRRETRFIILHTTEGPAKGSGEKLKRYGEAHYMIDEIGRVYEVVNIKRVAYHCGLSMWNGRSNLDECSIGIEMVGYHNRNLTQAQINSLRDLIAELKRRYPGISDERILTHSMVAYGSPNQWHKRNHRGRKRCGMKMAASSLRARLGIRAKPAYDPDVRARRLAVADKELFAILYSRGTSAAAEKKAEDNYKKTNDDNVVGPRRSAWDIARDAYNAPTTTYVFPNGTRKTGDKITDWKSMPRGTKVIVGDGGDGPKTTAKIQTSPSKPSSPSPSKSSSTSTSKPTNQQPKKPINEKNNKGENGSTVQRSNGSTAQRSNGSTVQRSNGSTADNVIGPGRSAWDIAKNAYNAASTVYILPDGTRKTGAEITDWKSLRKGTQVIVASLDGDAGTNGLFTAATVAMAGEAAKGLLDALVGDNWNATNTFYITPSGACFTGSELTKERLAAFEEGTKVLSGYRKAGPLTAGTLLWNLAGDAWNRPDTYYLFPNGSLQTGDKVNAGKLPLNTLIFLKERQ
ncbi:MAG: N-acetylmuramoyl-L-alanine amidase [Kiritimatiellae bacterium]|nr:N-acetylmuramoyl-L-alanine amidase [Kiritimatiellia bacterium]